LDVTDEALAEIAVKGNDPIYGARTPRRVIQEDVDAALAKYLLGRAVDRRDRMVIEKGGAIRIEKARDVR
jgi:ATP-dependent Clp protease ATP-binding subunit ClpB